MHSVGDLTAANPSSCRSAATNRVNLVRFEGCRIAGMDLAESTQGKILGVGRQTTRLKTDEDTPGVSVICLVKSSWIANKD